jgi:hypothetical protein
MKFHREVEVVYQVDMTLAGDPVSVLNMGWGWGGTDLKALRTKTNNENEKRTG